MAHAPVGGVVLDVGAGVGAFAVPAANAIGPDGTVYCVESRPDKVELLECNVALNGLERIIRFGQRDLSPEQWASSVFDYLLTGTASAVDLIKLDVSGLAGADLRHALAVVERFRPVIYLGISQGRPSLDPSASPSPNSRPGSSLGASLLLRLADLGYQLVSNNNRRTDEGIRLLDPNSAEHDEAVSRHLANNPGREGEVDLVAIPTNDRPAAVTTGLAQLAEPAQLEDSWS